MKTTYARLDVIARVIAALGGGYAVAALLSVTLARLLPLDRVQAVMAATMVALLVWPSAALGCFWTASAMRAWLGVFLASALLAGLALLTGWRP